MLDWSKFLVFLQSKNAVILAVFVAIVAFVPIEALRGFREQYEVLITLAGVFACCVIGVNALWWIGPKINNELEHWRSDRADEKELNLFLSLQPAQQLLILRMYYGGQKSHSFDANQEQIVELVNEDYVDESSVISSDGRGCDVVGLYLTERSFTVIRNNRAQLRGLKDELTSKGVGKEIDRWCVTRGMR